MDLFDKFSAEFSKNFITNNVYTLSQIKAKLENGSMKISAINDDYFIQEGDFLNYFIRENKSFNLAKNKIKIFYNNNIDEKNLEFLKLNNFSFNEKYLHMSICGANGVKYNEIETNKNDIEAIYSFLEKHFNGLIYFSKNEIKEKLIKNEIIYTKNDKNIAGILVYSKILSGAFIDYIAIDKQIAQKDLAYKLMLELALRQKNISLFVSENNEKAINFYKRFGFKKGVKNMNIYTNKEAK